MARLELFVAWNIYDNNGEILEIGDFVETYHNDWEFGEGMVGEGIVTELFCMADEEAAYIAIDPTEKVDSETAEFLQEIRDIREYERIEKIEWELERVQPFLFLVFTFRRNVQRLGVSRLWKK